MKEYRKTQIENGDSLMDFIFYVCSCCNLEIPENIGVHEICDDYICYDCVRSMFFESHDVRSIAFMDEVDGMLTLSMKARGKRRQLPRDVREKVFRRDKYTCKHCNSTDKKHLTVDHIHPYSLGGSDKFSNFQTLCRSCNSKKGAKRL